MNPQAVTVGARLGKRLAPILRLAITQTPDRASLCGGLLASIVGTIAGLIGPLAAAELLRITLARLDQAPEPGAIELPAGVRVEPSATEPPPTLAEEVASAKAALDALPEEYRRSIVLEDGTAPTKEVTPCAKT